MGATTVTAGADAGREEIAHRVAWAAVKQAYEKDAEGRWRAQD